MNILIQQLATAGLPRTRRAITPICLVAFVDRLIVNTQFKGLNSLFFKLNRSRCWVFSELCHIFLLTLTDQLVIRERQVPADAQAGLAVPMNFSAVY